MFSFQPLLETIKYIIRWNKKLNSLKTSYNLISNYISLFWVIVVSKELFCCVMLANSTIALYNKVSILICFIRIQKFISIMIFIFRYIKYNFNGSKLKENHSWFKWILWNIIKFFVVSKTIKFGRGCVTNVLKHDYGLFFTLWIWIVIINFLS